MILTKTQNDDVGNAYYHVHASPSGLVRIGLNPVLFGWRVVGWLHYAEGYKYSSIGPAVNWCAGNDQKQVNFLFSALRHILEPREDDEQAFEGLPPFSKVKPFYNDPDFLSWIVHEFGEEPEIEECPPIGALRRQFQEDTDKRYQYWQADTYGSSGL